MSPHRFVRLSGLGTVLFFGTLQLGAFAQGTPEAKTKAPPLALAFDWPAFAVTSKPPAGLSLTLSLPRNHFYQGEIIPAVLTYSDSSRPGYHVWSGKADRSGRLPNVKFAGRDEQGNMLEDSLGWIFDMAIARMGGGQGGDVSLGSWDLPITVNEWLRFDHPGRYKIAAWSDSVEPAGLPVPPFSGRGIELVSNVREITIEPLPTDRAKAIVDDARKKIDAVAGVNPDTPRTYSESQQIEDAEHAATEAMTTLRYLQTPEARAELRQVLAQFDFSRSWGASMGLYAAPDPAAEARLLLDDVKTGRVKVNDQVINTYATLKSYPVVIAAWRKHAGGNGNEMEKTWEAQEMIAKGARLEMLAAARYVARQTGTTNLDLIWTAFLTDQNDPAARADLIAHQLDFSEDRKERILFLIKDDLGQRQHERELHQSPFGPTDAEKFLPLVHAEVAAPTYSPEAFAILAHLRPHEAQPILVSAVAGPDHPFFDQSGGFAVNGSAMPLLDLPGGPIPQLQESLRDLLHQDRYAADAILLIAQYGAPELLPDVMDWFHHTTNESVWVEAAALRFWIRCDPTAGINALSIALQQRGTNDNYKYLLQEVLVAQWMPLALPLVIESMDDPVFEVKHSALQVAILHGDASCAGPTLAALDQMPLQAKAQGARDLLSTKNWTWSADQERQLRRDADLSP